MKRGLTKSTLGLNSQLGSKQSQIETIRNETLQLKDLQFDLFKLNDQISSIEAKYNMALDEKDRVQGLQKSKLQINNKSIHDLRSDVDQIRRKITESTLEVNNMVRDNYTLEKTCENKENYIVNLSIALKQLEKTNQIKSGEMQQLEQMLSKFKQHKGKLNQQCQKLYKRVDQNIQAFKCLDKQTKNQLVLQKSLNSKLQKANEQGQQLIMQMKSRQSLLKQTTLQYEFLDQQITQATKLNQKIGKQTKNLEQIYNQQTLAVQNLQRANNQKLLKLKQVQNSTAKAQEQLSSAALQKQSGLKQHNEKVTRNKDLNAQIDECLIKILQLENINKALQKNIENYIACDQQARIMLDRRQKMTDLLQQVGTKLSKTQSAIAHLF